ncbi:MAG: phosphoribosylformylglycinamidine cyclo-ligase [Treponema sp.]|jgi:phosphoribosylformylglycinamidine cyclo-ligase|nr:phosphoribosylformylglycinamidine cyclo-ligase [Treponema sp.]
MNYKQAGVDIEEGYKAVDKYRGLSAQTINGKSAGAVLNGIGSFAGMYSLKEFFAGMKEPVLVSGTDGVGTKLDIAFKMKKYDTVGIDCVAMCVNDILCHGARPLFFLDYLACGKLDADVAAEIVKGVAIGCRETGSVLLGGETAEMPGFYDAGKYDIAGFSVGIVDRAKIVDGAQIRAGDTLIGIASSGPHSNGFSLIRKTLTDINEDFGGMPIGMALLEPTRLYVKPVLSLMEKIEIHGMAHITGGGFYENIPRMFKRGEVSPLPPAPQSGSSGTPHNGGEAPPVTPPTFDAVITEGSWTIPPIFARIAAAVNGAAIHGADCYGPAAQKTGAELLKTDNALKKQMFNTFNMGIGFVLAIAPADVRQTIEHLDSMNFPAYEIGTVEKAADVNAVKGALRFAGH